MTIALDKGGVLRWHLWLIEALRVRYDVAVLLLALDNAVRLPAACRVAFELERILYRIPSGAAVDTVDAAEIASLPIADIERGHGFDSAIDCTGRLCPGGRRVLTPLFDGMPGEIGLVSALLDNRRIVIAIDDAERPLDSVTATPALADRKVLLHAIDNACSIAVELVIKALERQPIPVTRRLTPPRRDASVAGSLAFVASSLAWKVNRYLSLRLAGREQWSVAWRKTGGVGLIEGRDGDFAVVPDDGRRYFADPFVLRHRGRTAVFMEEFSFATLRGRIAVAMFEDDGALSPPRPALEDDCHLSYPHVFESDGAVWMIPESGDRARVDLYRAVDFPFRWRREATLLEGVAAYDATVMRDGEGWWMFAATRVRRSTGWDVLNAYYAPDIRGPWRPCADNPVVLDARAARSGGGVIAFRGERLRPVQDCSPSYGSAIALWRIDRIDRAGLEQTQVARITSDRFGVHTFNAASGFEVIDGFGRTRGAPSLTVSLRKTPSDPPAVPAPGRRRVEREADGDAGPIPLPQRFGNDA
ncbi:glucosamine inositolphosphorylceramide transferase family protein [Roseiarcus fermentans]|uniref:glucosamine inositolphosphorylceramide transferase family protein n=1 Tax=Roseiarcus fermentans TaxID=1473586 RepID=UPI000DEB67CE|nr:hypothetical protein [Roseiarcus fermentans]